MSYILEALRKVEQQRGHLHGYGLSSRLRYYGATSAASRPRTLIVVAAAVTGALLSGLLSAYLATASKSALPLQVAAAQQPELASYIPDASENVRQIMSNENIRQMSSQTARSASLQTPVPGHHAPAREAVAQIGHQEKAKLSRRDQETTIPQENALSKQQPASAPSRPIEVAAVQNAPRASAMKAGAPLPETTPERRVQKNDLLVTMRTPLSVNEQPSRNDDVIRPPEEKQSTPPEEPMVLSMLPPEIQSIVPKMSIDGVVYSPDPKQRVVVINTKFYNEGQSTSDGVTIEAIQQTDIICSYQGQRFRLSR